jgi:fructose-specific phosphotransferase system IIC component
MTILAAIAGFLAGVVVTQILNWVVIGWVLDGASNFGRGK